MTAKKKLIEVALPLDAINKASAREKSIRHGHPSTLHLWWARRPLAAARAVIFSQMVDDPSAYVDVLRADPKLRRKAEAALKARLKLWEEARTLAEKAKEAGLPVPEPGPAPTLDDMLADQERQRLFRIIEDLVLWENTTNEKVLQAARDEIWQSWRRTCAENAGHPRAKELFDRHKLPAFHDPFAGGGALPLEAQRLGLESYASDLNPVAVLINKAMIEIPPKFAGRPPVNPDHRKSLFSLGAPASSRPNPSEHKQWFSRGYLPHFDLPDLVQSVTFRLADSLPQTVLEKMTRELAARPESERQTERERRIAAYLDASHGACWLKDPRVAALVENALLHFDGQRYRLLAWCVMPNHVHALVETKDGFPLSEIVHSWKSFTANEANKILGRTGDFWQREYHDRFIRDDDHYRNAVVYIENNPVKAGLVKTADAWRYSSAWSHEEKAAGKDAGAPSMWRGAQGLAEDVRYYGQWMRDEAEKRIGHLYPKVEITVEMAKERPDLKPYVGRKLTVIAWLWARTVKSPNPAFAHVDVPLASTFMLSTKEGKEAYVEVLLAEPLLAGSAGFQPAGSQSRQDGGAPSNASGGYRFTVKVGKPKNAEAAKNGTKLAGANFVCVVSGSPISGDYIKAEAQAGRMGARMLAIVAEGVRGRVYLPPTQEMEEIARQAAPEWKPDVEFLQQALGFRVGNYGMTKWSDLFTPRQIVALTTFSDLVQEARERVKHDAESAFAGSAGFQPAESQSRQDGGAPSEGLADGFSGVAAYADAVAVYLGLGVGKAADYNAALVSWSQSRDQAAHVFTKQALPMVWDYAEVNVFAGAAGDVVVSLEGISRVLSQLGTGSGGMSLQADAQSQEVSIEKVISTDPPYYDNIGYADLSDFFYVWLRRSLKSVFPDLFATVAVPKAEELVATPHRHGGSEQAESFFLDGMTQAMRRLAEQAHPAFPVTIYYAFKQSETESDGKGGGTMSTGWDTFLEAVIRAGFLITGTWPMRTERGARSRGIGSNALASSIILVCRPRGADAPTATRREFIAALKAELPRALALLQRGNIAPVDLAQAAIGPGMAVYTRYARVLDAVGKPLAVREALALINQTLDEALAEQEGDFDADSRWALAWFEHSGFAEGDYGMAEQLSKSKNTSVEGMGEAGIIESKRGRVRLLRPEELPADWDPEKDARLTAWEMVHHLIRVLEAGGESGASVLAAKLGTKAEVARELCYRLYTLCERKKRAAEALSYNGLVQSWPEITRLAREGGTSREAQTTMFGNLET